MKENPEFGRRGTGCGNPGAAVDPEVLPPVAYADQRPQLMLGGVTFDRRSILNSPCTYLLLGLAGGVILSLYLRDRR